MVNLLDVDLKRLIFLLSILRLGLYCLIRSIIFYVRWVILILDNIVYITNLIYYMVKPVGFFRDLVKYLIKGLSL